jgi:type II secretory pathway predicted ATPase ExeA
VGFSNPLKLTHDPFGREAPTPILIPVQSAFDDVMREIGCGAAVIVIAGPTGSGKTFLIGLIERAHACDGRSVQRIERGDLVNVAPRADCDLLLVDEADSTDQVTLQSLLSNEGGRRPASIVFACRPSATQRFVRNGVPVFVTLSTLSPAEARSFLLERAEGAGRPNLFNDEALNTLIAASGGSPRLLKSIGGHALFFADSEGANQIDPKHVEEALLAQFGVQPSVSAEAKSEGQESNRSLNPEALVTQKFDSARGEAKVDATTAQTSLPLDQSRLWDPLRDSRKLLTAALAAWLVLMSAVLYDKNFGGFIYGTSVSARRIMDPLPVTDPLVAMQKVANAITPHAIVLTIISSAPLQHVEFAQRIVPGGKNKIVSARRSAAKVSAQAALHGRAAISVSGGRRKLLSSRGSEAEVAVAQARLHTRMAGPVAVEPTTFDRLRNFLNRQVGVYGDR